MSLNQLLDMAAKMDDVDGMRKACKGQWNVCDSEGRNAIWWASHRGSVKCLRTILEDGQGIDGFERADNNGWAPIHCASICGRVECLRVDELACVVL